MKNHISYTTIKGIYMSCGSVKDNKGDLPDREISDTYCLLYFTKGKGKVTVGDEVYNICEGQSFLAYPFSDFTIKANYDNPLSCKWIKFGGLEVGWIINRIDFSKHHPIVDEMPVAMFERYFEIGNMGDSLHAELRCCSRLLLILSYYLQYYPKSTSDKNSYAELARSYIENNYADVDCNVKKVADHLKIDRTYLYRLFKEEMGVPVIAYINHCRIAKACMMLEDETVSIKDAAYAVGYSDQMYFSKVFKRLKGSTPTEYRQRQKKLHMQEDNNLQ